jgi:VWFA-related protein
MHTHAKWVLVVVWAASLAAFPQTGTRVTLNVVAFDSHDQTVGDLTSLDFQVSDQSKPQHIVSFHRNGEPQGTLNNLPHAPQVGPPVVILFDLLNDNLSKRGFGTEEIIQALEHLESSDSLYLYLLSSQGDLQPVRGLPAPQEHNPPQTKPWTEHIKPLLTAAIDHAYGVKLGNAGTFPAIEAIGAALQPFPGRKNLIWITNGVPLSSRERGASIDNSSLVNGMATTLDRNGVTLSSVYLGSNVGNGDIDTLEQFADLTGGKVYANDIEKAVKQGMAASGSGYVIQYDGPRLDGKYHKIRVTCSRKGVHLQVKQGYYAN